MATEDKSKQRKKEVKNPSYTTQPVSEIPNGLSVLEYADQDVLDENTPKIRTTLSPDDFNIQHDEDTTYKELFISDQNAARFQPPQITGENAPDIYQTRQDDIQLKPQEYIDTDCICADGRAAKGRKNVRTGQIDCDCDTNLSKKPSIYKPNPVKPRVVDTAPLKDQAGVSYMGNVKLEPCKIIENEARERAAGTLNNVIQAGRETEEQSNKGKTINVNSQNWNIYDTCDYNLYGI